MLPNIGAMQVSSVFSYQSCCEIIYCVQSISGVFTAIVNIVSIASKFYFHSDMC